jgi:threonine/homoserine/homoserine lactone efflux protein
MRVLRIASIAFVTGFSGAVMPGPMLLLTIGQVSAHGFWAAPAIVLGHALLELIVVAALILGLRRVLESTPVRGAISLIGGLALGYMSWDMLRNAADMQIEMTIHSEALPWAKLILQGAAVCVVNPYFTAWWATIGVGQMAHTRPSNSGEYVAFYLGHEMSDLVWFSFVGLVLALGGRFLNLTWLIFVCAAAVGILALWFLYSAARSLSAPRVADGTSCVCSLPPEVSHERTDVLDGRDDCDG